MFIIKMGKSGRITLPRELLLQFGLREGHTLLLLPDGDRAIVKPLTKTLLDYRGSVPVPEPQDFDQIRKQVSTKRARRDRRCSG